MTIRRSKPEKTLGDYVAIAISPVLIMSLVGSLVFFLLKLSYQGDYEGRLQWTLFWFVFASVLVSRISIEQGIASASGYGMALAAVTGVWLLRFVDFVLGAWCLLAVVWWCTSKLTWDCTLINDDEDASGEGLLQAAGLDRSSSLEQDLSDDDAKRRGKSASFDQKQRPESRGGTVSWWRRFLRNRSETKGKGQPHAPGLWVVFFSLAALPLFGFGQALLPESDPAGRRYGFQLLVIYVASALGLLLTTSFLGLRRYLRQRHLQMPAAMAGAWVGLGTTLTVVTLFFCILLPRPDAAYSLPALVPRIVSVIQRASDYAFIRGGFGKGPGRELKDSEGDEGWIEESRGQSAEKDLQSRGAKGNQVPRPGQSGQPSQTSMTGAPTTNFLKWVLYILFALLALYILKRNWAGLVAALKKILQDFRNLWNQLFGRIQGSAKLDQHAAAEVPRKPRPFASFRNPFDLGTAQRMTPAELLLYSFDALQAWAGEQNMARRSDQTPFEFAEILQENIPSVSHGVRPVVQMYVELAYASQPPAPDGIARLEELWRLMTRPAQSAPLVSTS
jgi:hypothetical protein